MTKEISMERRLAFVRQDIARLLEELPKSILSSHIERYDDLETVLNNIAIACDLDDTEPNHWLVTWFEVFRYDEEEGTETIAEFDTEKQALHFMWEYSLKYPETELGYDEWASDIDGTNKKILKQEI